MDTEYTFPAPEGNTVCMFQGCCTLYNMAWNNDSLCLCMQDMKKSKRSELLDMKIHRTFS